MASSFQSSRPLGYVYPGVDLVYPPGYVFRDKTTPVTPLEDYRLATALHHPVEWYSPEFLNRVYEYAAPTPDVTYPVDSNSLLVHTQEPKELFTILGSRWGLQTNTFGDMSKTYHPYNIKKYRVVWTITGPLSSSFSGDMIIVRGETWDRDVTDDAIGGIVGTDDRSSYLQDTTSLIPLGFDLNGTYSYVQDNGGGLFDTIDMDLNLTYAMGTVGMYKQGSDFILLPQLTGSLDIVWYKPAETTYGTTITTTTTTTTTTSTTPGGTGTSSTNTFTNKHYNQNFNTVGTTTVTEPICATRGRFGWDQIDSARTGLFSTASSSVELTGTATTDSFTTPGITFLGDPLYLSFPTTLEGTNIDIPTVSLAITPYEYY